MLTIARRMLTMDPTLRTQIIVLWALDGVLMFTLGWGIAMWLR